MKKIFCIVLSILMIFPLLFLTSCKKEYDSYLGIWLTLDESVVGENKYYNTVEELEKVRVELNVEYYVDAYSTDKVISHLNGEVPFYFSITYKDDATKFYRMINVYYGKNGYYLVYEAPTIPYKHPLNPTAATQTIRKIKEQTIYFVYRYESLTTQE